MICVHMCGGVNRWTEGGSTKGYQLKPTQQRIATPEDGPDTGSQALTGAGQNQDKECNACDTQASGTLTTHTGAPDTIRQTSEIHKRGANLYSGKPHVSRGLHMRSGAASCIAGGC